MTTLTEPDFIERDPEVILQEVFDTWEQKGGAPLEPTQLESLLLHVWAYRETLLRIGIQEAAKSTLLRFAVFPVIDYLGELIGAPRLEAQAATSTERFSLAAVHGTDVPIASGTRVQSKDGRATFATTVDATITAGELSVDVAVVATESGNSANGYIAGQVTTLVDSVPLIDTVTNTNTTDGGAPKETDERYLERLLLASDAPSTAGSENGYRFHALSASTLVADVEVLNPAPLDITIVVLATYGEPTTELLGIVEAAVSSKEARPMGDVVSVVAGSAVEWILQANLTLYANADPTATLSAAQAAADAFVANRRSRLGRDATLGQIMSRLYVSGVYEVALVSPTADVQADPSQWLECTSVVIGIAGTVDEEQPDA